jgi:hypothetical protein
VALVRLDQMQQVVKVATVVMAPRSLVRFMLEAAAARHIEHNLI